MNYFESKKIHFIGILGVSMRGLAMITSTIATQVSGSDSTYNESIDMLHNHGIDVYIGHDVDHILNADCVVYSSAIPEDDEELVYARHEKKLCIERCEYLSMLMRLARYGIAVAGTHGKSTTTALLGHIMREAGLDTTAHVGADLVEETDDHHIGEYFLTEACEYRRSFLHLSPDIGVVLNIDYDHPDEYKSIDEVESAFDEFMSKSRIVVAHESVHYNGAITFGMGESADYRISDIRAHGGAYTFCITHEDRVVTIESPLYGAHNILNVTATYVVARLLGLEDESIARAISTFKGIRRRFEIVGNTSNGTTVIHDYAHHPEEIRRVIATASLMNRGRLIVVFEPHTYSRTKSLITSFCDAFYWADSLILLPTYSAREVEEDGYTTLELITYMREVGEYPLYFDSYNRARQYLEKTTSGNDTILVLGAGSIYHLADMLVEKNI